MIGMKDQFNKHDLPAHPLHDQVQYIADEMGFVLFDRSALEWTVFRCGNASKSRERTAFLYGWLRGLSLLSACGEWTSHTLSEGIAQQASE